LFHRGKRWFTILHAKPLKKFSFILTLRNENMMGTLEYFNTKIVVNESQIYREPIREEDHMYELENIYKLTTRQQDYINPIADGNLRWRSDNTCSSKSEEALENWQNQMYEVSTRRCARLTREVH
jgi:hypothetical protein